MEIFSVGLLLNNIFIIIINPLISIYTAGTLIRESMPNLYISVIPSGFDYTTVDMEYRLN